MNEPENKNLTAPDSADWQEQYESLRHSLVSTLVLVIVLSGALNLFLLRQVKYARLDLDNFRQYANAQIATYKSNDGPLLETFLRNIVEYGRTHPDFAPIMEKYNLKAGPVAAGAPAAPTTPPAGGGLTPPGKK
jgi:hypothetical protein